MSTKLVYGESSVYVEDTKAACKAVEPELRRILEGWGYKNMSTTTERIKNGLYPLTDELKVMAELLERAMNAIHTTVTPDELDRLKADFERFQKGE